MEILSFALVASKTGGCNSPGAAACCPGAEPSPPMALTAAGESIPTSLEPARGEGAGNELWPCLSWRRPNEKPGGWISSLQQRKKLLTATAGIEAANPSSLHSFSWEALRAKKHQQNELNAVVVAMFPRGPCALPLDSPIRKPRSFVEAVLKTL